MYLAYTEDKLDIARAIKTGFVSNPDGGIYFAATGVALGFVVHVVIPRVGSQIWSVARSGINKLCKREQPSPSPVWPWELWASVLTQEVMDDEILRDLLAHQRNWESTGGPDAAESKDSIDENKGRDQ